MKTIDYSVPDGIDLDAVRAAGYVGVLRYLTGPWALTRAEVDELHAHGLAVGLVYESTAGRAFDGWAAGADDARRAEMRADALGAPAGVAIYYAVDADVGAATLAHVIDYFVGVASTARRPIGCYGEDGLWPHVRDVIAYRWQPAASSWSDVYPSPAAHLVQLVGQPLELGGAYDENDVQADPWGQWSPAGAPAPVRTVKETAVFLRATTDSTVNPDVHAGSVWLDVGTEFLREDSPPDGVVILDRDGDDIGRASLHKKALNDAAAAILAGNTATPQPESNVVVSADDEHAIAAAVVDELAQRLDPEAPKVWTSDKTGERHADAPDPAAAEPVPAAEGVKP